jgi:hypothetical protein
MLRLMASWRAWEQAFHGLPPVGYILRRSVEDRWIRLHSLPGGKRYATGSDEAAALLDRQNVVASTVLGDGLTVTAWVLFHRDESPCVDTEQWAAVDPPRWRVSGDDREWLAGLRFFERTLPWEPGALDEELTLRADDRMAAMAIFSGERASAFCPYDGGMDLLLGSAEEVESIRQLFPDWVSAHPDGSSS